MITEMISRRQLEITDINPADIWANLIAVPAGDRMMLPI